MFVTITQITAAFFCFVLFCFLSYYCFFFSHYYNYRKWHLDYSLRDITSLVLISFFNIFLFFLSFSKRMIFFFIFFLVFFFFFLETNDFSSSSFFFFFFFFFLRWNNKNSTVSNLFLSYLLINLSISYHIVWNIILYVLRNVFVSLVVLWIDSFNFPLFIKLII